MPPAPARVARVARTALPVLARAAITLAAIAAAVVPGDARAQSPDDTAATIVRGPLGARADSVLRAAAAQGFSGVVLLARDGEIVLKKGYGVANRAEGIAMSGNSVVQIGSNTKDFTVVALLRLVERGRVRLTDSLGTYLPDVPADKRGITVEHLLHHRAGFAQHLGDDFEALSREQMERRALASPLRFAPGTEERYSNVGYSLLGAIIERVTGRSYDEHVRDEILRPLGLHDTGSRLPGFDPRRVARGYRGERDMGSMLEKPHAADGPYWNLRANGGMLSTAHDMLRFYRALFGGERLLKAETRALRFEDGPTALAGSDMTHFFLYERLPRQGVELIVATNTSDFPPRRVMPAVRALLGAGGGAGGPPPQVVVDTAPPSGGARPDAAMRWPDTPAARAAQQWLAAFNSGDPAVMRRFIEQSTAPDPDDRRTIEQRLGAYQAMHGTIGALTPLAAEESEPTRLLLRTRSVREGELRVLVETEATAPFRARSVRIEQR